MKMKIAGGLILLSCFIVLIVVLLSFLRGPVYSLAEEGHSIFAVLAILIPVYLPLSIGISYVFEVPIAIGLMLLLGGTKD